VALGDVLLPGAAEFFQEIKERGGQFVFITNNSTKSIADYIKKFRQMGVSTDPQNFVTASTASASWLRQHAAGKTIYTLGTRSLIRELEGHGIRVTTDPDTQDISFVLVAYDSELTSKKLTDTCRILQTRPVTFLATNPELLKLTLESDGQNLVRGLALLAEDLERSADHLNIRLTDESAFELGRDLATTPGRVVLRTELFELIQYSPTTATVGKTPVLVVPPFINKYYIMDMRPQNSLVAWLVAQGQTVFMISWRNPGVAQGQVDLDDYVVDGVIAALDAVEAATGEREVHGIGYCIGGTALSLAMGWLAARRQKQRVRSATLFTTLLDFSQPGELGIFIHEPIIAALEAQNEARGIMDGRQLAVSFSLLRENSLYWNYYIDSYLKGQSPVASDLLHWNSNSTNVAGKIHNSLLRRLYLENQLVKGELKIRHTRIALAKVKTPVLLVSAVDDHIALWQGTWQGMALFGGERRFILAESGHIAGIINPPDANKYGFWQSEVEADSPAQWLAGATHQSGSWWPEMMRFIKDRDEAEPVPARQPVEGLEAAPGSYVKVRLNPVFAGVRMQEEEPA
jgi:polyhydroxyalkanoate synthase